MARWVLHPEQLEQIDYKPLLGHLADDIVDVGKVLAPKRTTALARSIHVDEVTNDLARVVADAAHSDEPDPADAHYAAYVELGTSDTPAQPYLKPATYRYRSG